MYGFIATLGRAYFETNIGDSETAAAAATPSKQCHITKKIVTNLNKSGVAIIENVLSNEELQLARLDIENILKEGRFEYAESKGSTIRQDMTCWIRSSDGTDEAVQEAKNVKVLGKGLMHCVGLLRGVASALDDLGYNRSDGHIVPTQCQLSCYSPAESATQSLSPNIENGIVNKKIGYAPHRDAAPDDNFWEIGVLEWYGEYVTFVFFLNIFIILKNVLHSRFRAQDYRSRSITAILYLNKTDWDCDEHADGGALKLFMNTASDDISGKTATEVQYISPAGGTLILFDSRYLLHEVEPSTSPRYALTLWICGQKNEMSGKSPPDYIIATNGSSAKHDVSK